MKMIKFLKNHFLQRKKIAELEAEIKRLNNIIQAQCELKTPNEIRMEAKAKLNAFLSR